MLRLFICMAVAFGLMGLFAIAFFYLEPVKTKRMLRHAYNRVKIMRSDKGQRQASINDYEPIVLSGDFPHAIEEPTVSQETPIRLIDVEFEPNSSSSLRKASVSLDGQQRNAITGVVPFNFSYNLQVPKDGHLWFGVNQEGLGSSAGGLHFAIQVSSEAGTERMYEVQLPSSHKGWKDSTVDLSVFAGQQVRIRFSSSLEDSTAPTIYSTQKSVRAYWSDLFLESRAKASKKPNIFLILIDTLRPDHLSCYGYERTTSPNIDKLAAEGIRFEKAFSVAPWTNPSILALFTGLYPSDVWEPKPHKEAIRWALPKKVDTLAEILSVNGYFTIAASDHPGIGHRLFGQGFDIYAHLYHNDGPYVKWRETDAEKILKQLHTLLEGRPERGLFTYVHLIYPHQPYKAPPPYDGYFGAGTPKIRRENKQEVINMYDEEIKRADDVVGEFLDYIRQLNLDDDSIVILLSDHGEGFWEHGLWEHGNSLYNELLHIPLILRAPGRIAEAKTIRQLVRNLDLLPTILDLVGIEYDSKNYRGISLLPLTRGEDGENSKRLAFSEFPHSKIVFGRTIQSLTEKLIDPSQDGKPLEYYDIIKDPGELNNLSSAQPAKAHDLISIMNDTSRSTSSSRVAQPAERVEPSEDTIKKLKSLGYIQ